METLVKIKTPTLEEIIAANPQSVYEDGTIFLDAESDEILIEDADGFIENWLDEPDLLACDRIVGGYETPEYKTDYYSPKEYITEVIGGYENAYRQIQSELKIIKAPAMKLIRTNNEPQLQDLTARLLKIRIEEETRQTILTAFNGHIMYGDALGTIETARELGFEDLAVELETKLANMEVRHAS